MLFRTTLDLMQKQFEAKYVVSSTIRHKGEKGRQRENGLLKFLRENLPTAYGVGTGEIIPFEGDTTSPQCDIIIYDQLRFPIIGRTESVQQVPLEAVYAVIEVKSLLTVSEINDAQNKFKAILQMPRCRTNRRTRSGARLNPLFAVFAYKAALSLKHLHKSLEKHPFDCLTAVLDLGVNLSAKPNEKIDTTWVDPYNDRFCVLTVFYWALLDGLSCMDLGKPDFDDLINWDEVL